MCLFLAFLEVSNKRNYTLSHIQTSIHYLQLKYYKVLLPYSGKSFLLNHCFHILLSPWRGRKWSRLKTHKQIKKKNQNPHAGEIKHLPEKAGYTFLSVPSSSLRWTTSLLSGTSARPWPSVRTLPAGSVHSQCVFLAYNFSRDLILQV